MKFLDLFNRGLLRLTRSPLELLSCPRAVLTLCFDWIVVVFIILFVLRVCGVVVEFEVLEVELERISTGYLMNELWDNLPR